MALLLIVLSIGVMINQGNALDIHDSILSKLKQLKVENPLKSKSYEKDLKYFSSFKQEDIDSDDFKEFGAEVMESYNEELQIVGEIKAVETQLRMYLDSSVNVAHLDIMLRDLSIGQETALKEGLLEMLDYSKVLKSHIVALEMEISSLGSKSITINEYWNHQHMRQTKRRPRMQYKWFLK